MRALFTLHDAAAWLPGSRLVGDGATLIARVHTDTRSLKAGDFFVALKGDNFDAHDFLPQARAAGARAAVAEQGLAAAGLMGLEVPHSLRALGELAAGGLIDTSVRTISGASMGASEEQACISDMARAAASFSPRSRTMVRASTTPPQAARPCRKRRPTRWPASTAKAQPMLVTT